MYNKDLCKSTTRICVYVQQGSVYMYNKDLCICTTRICVYVRQRSVYMYIKDLCICTTRICVYVQQGYVSTAKVLTVKSVMKKQDIWKEHATKPAH